MNEVSCYKKMNTFYTICYNSVYMKGGCNLDKETKTALGKILGNVYLLQKKQDITEQSDSHIFGLLNGIESALDVEFEEMDFISKEEIRVVENALEPYLDDKEEVEIRSQSLRLGLEHEHEIDQAKFIDICKYLSGRGNFQAVIKQLGITDIRF